MAEIDMKKNVSYSNNVKLWIQLFFQKYMSNLLGKAFDHYGLDNTGATHIEA